MAGAWSTRLREGDSRSQGLADPGMGCHAHDAECPDREFGRDCRARLERMRTPCRNRHVGSPWQNAGQATAPSRPGDGCAGMYGQGGRNRPTEAICLAKMKPMQLSLWQASSEVKIRYKIVKLKTLLFTQLEGDARCELDD